MKRYRVVRGVLALPRDLLAAPGGFNMRVSAGEEFDLADERANTRFIRRRIHSGDLIEVVEEQKGKSK